MALNVAILHYIMALMGTFFKPIGPLLTNILGIHMGTYAAVIDGIDSIAAFSQIIWGIITDRCKHIGILLALVVVVELISIALFGLQTSIIATFLLIVVAKLAHAAFHPVGGWIAGAEGKDIHITLFGIMGSLGAASSPLLLTWYITRYGLNKLWILAAILLLISLLLSYPVINKKQETPKRHILPPLHLTLPLIGIFIVVSSRAFIMEVFHTYIPFYIQQNGGSIIRSGLTLTLGMLLGTLFNFLGSYIRGQKGIKLVNILSFTGMALFGYLFMEASTPLMQTLYFMLFDASAFFSFSANLVEAQFILPSHRGFASAVALGFSWSFGHLLASIYASAFGNNIKLMLITAVIVSILMIIISLIPSKILDRNY